VQLVRLPGGEQLAVRGLDEPLLALSSEGSSALMISSLSLHLDKLEVHLAHAACASCGSCPCSGAGLAHSSTSSAGRRGQLCDGCLDLLDLARCCVCGEGCARDAALDCDGVDLCATCLELAEADQHEPAPAAAAPAFKPAKQQQQQQQQEQRQQQWQERQERQQQQQQQRRQQRQEQEEQQQQQQRQQQQLDQVHQQGLAALKVRLILDQFMLHKEQGGPPAKCRPTMGQRIPRLVKQDKVGKDAAADTLIIRGLIHVCPHVSSLQIERLSARQQAADSLAADRDEDSRQAAYRT
jgi:hypothetical protein